MRNDPVQTHSGGVVDRPIRLGDGRYIQVVRPSEPPLNGWTGCRSHSRGVSGQMRFATRDVHRQLDYGQLRSRERAIDLD